MIHSRSDQRWQKVKGGVQPGALRPTSAEKVRRLEPALSLNPSDLLTSSNLTAHTHVMRAHAYTCARVYVCVCISVRYVRRLDSRLIRLIFFRPTSVQPPNRLDGYFLET